MTIISYNGSLGTEGFCTDSAKSELHIEEAYWEDIDDIVRVRLEQYEFVLVVDGYVHAKHRNPEKALIVETIADTTGDTFNDPPIRTE